MSSDSGAGQWIRAFADDSQVGDLIRMDGKMPRRISKRDNPPYWVPVLELMFSDVTMTIGKSHAVEIWDPDGSVAERLHSSRVTGPMDGNSGSGGAFIVGQFEEPGLARGIVAKQRE